MSIVARNMPRLLGLKLVCAVMVALGVSSPAVACSLDGSIACNTRHVERVAVPSANQQERYWSCNGVRYPGAEVSLSFTPPAGQRVYASLYVPSETIPGEVIDPDDVDYDLMVTRDSCDPFAACTASGNNLDSDEFETWVADGSPYILNADEAYAKFGGDWDVILDVACPQPCDPGLDLAGVLTCAADAITPLSGSTVGASNVLPYYECGAPEPALITNSVEVIYQFSPLVSGEVTLHLANQSTDHDLFLLDDSCEGDGGHCLLGTTATGTADEALTFTADAARTYYIAVEAVGGEGSFDLYFDHGSGGCSEDCDDGDDEDGDLADCLDSKCWDQPECPCDVDGDGEDGAQCGGTDCDDEDPQRSHLLAEVCDGIDNDCSDVVDDGITAPPADEQDGVCSGATKVCGGEAGWLEPDYTARPDFEAPEASCDGLDNDCDGVADEQLSAPLAGKQGGVCEGSLQVCGGIQGWLQPDYDAVIPEFEASEATCDGLDNDCDGALDESLVPPGQPSKLLGVCAGEQLVCAGESGWEDPDWDSVAGYEALESLCDGLDNDCNGNVDAGLTPPPALLQQGVCSGQLQECGGVNGWQEPDYSRIAGFEAPAELSCDSLDNDCDGLTDGDDPSVPGDTEFYADVDDDGFGDPADSVFACVAPTAHVDNPDDCDDDQSGVNPDATEVAHDGIDQDCDGADLVDADGDGWDGGCDYRLVLDCDCDDDDPSVNPGAVGEVANHVDDNCDGRVDEGTSHYDDDGDGVAELGGDCDDADPSVRPGAIESCNGVDDDCDGAVDEGTLCADDDGDGYCEAGCTDGSLSGDCNDGDPMARPGLSEIADDGIDNDCDGIVDDDVSDPDGDGYSATGGDCDETAASIYPGAPETPNGLDDDCDGVVDEGTTAFDDDGDGASESQGDCDDANARVGPTQAEDPDNGLDDDCDGYVDEGGAFTDDDGDGLSEAAGDCDDTVNTVFPGAPEWENAIDDDCDGSVDEDFMDLDRDGFTEADGDCNDDEGWAHPDMDELCDGIDNSCDGRIDEGCAGVDFGSDSPAGTGCSTSSGSSWLAFPALLLLVGRRRGLWAGLALGAVACNNDLSVSSVSRELAATPALIDFGRVPVGSEGQDFVQLDSLSGGDLNIRNVDLLNIDGEHFVHEGETQFPVPRGESVFSEVWFRPTGPGFHRATMTFLSDADDSQVTIDLRGHAIVPDAAVYPLSVDVGPVEVGSYGSTQVTVANHSDLTITVSDAHVTNPVFAVSLPLPFDVPAGQTRVVPLVFTPISDQPATGELYLMLGEVALNGVVLLGNDCQGGDPNVYDLDGDGTTACSGDCGEGDPSTGPGASELPDGIDNDCDGSVDEGTVRSDDDLDGYCEHDVSCVGGAEPGDCHDGAAAVNPAAEEDMSNGIDDDCDGVIDGGSSDQDGDGYATGGGDCDDGDANRYPGAPELADFLDNDCDGAVDEGTVHADDDNDGYCEHSQVCVDHALPFDCNDADASVNPGQVELADFVDNNCDGDVDEGTDNADDDGDGFTENGGDCDDDDPGLSPGLGTC